MYNKHTKLQKLKNFSVCFCTDRFIIKHVTSASHVKFSVRSITNIKIFDQTEVFITNNNLVFSFKLYNSEFVIY